MRLKKYLPDFTRRNLVISFAVLASVFILANLTIYIIYNGKAYPNSTIALVNVSSQNLAKLKSTLSVQNYVPKTIQVKSQTGTHAIATKPVVSSVNIDETISSLKQTNSFLPIINLFKDHRSASVLEFKQSNLAKQSSDLAKSMTRPPINAQVRIKAGSFILSGSKDGYKYTAVSIEKQIKAATTSGDNSLNLNGQKVIPAIQTEELRNSFEQLQAQQNTPVSYTISGKKVTVPKKDMTTWYMLEDNSFTLSDDLIRAYLVSKAADAGVSIDNIDEAVTNISISVKAGSAVDLNFKVSKIVKTYSYCIAFKGVSGSNLEALADKLASVYSEPKGWSLNSQVVFTKVSSGCDFTVWLSAAALMPTFGAICDPMWSCNVGRNVVLNYVRWTNASPAWNKAKGSLADYRSMVINHETGHYLGFGHSHCGGPGQLAPVMQQQSIDLEGCKFNPWPLSSELARFRARIF